MTKREKKPLLTVPTANELEQVLGEYAALDARKEKMQAKMDEEITRIRDKYSEELGTINEKREEKFMKIQLYAENNRSLFDKKRSLESAHGTFGFRVGMPKLKTLKGFTWASVTKLLMEFLPAYVRKVEEPAKDKLLADRDKTEMTVLFPKCGFTVVQDETFFIDLKKEETIESN